jgi:nitric oxide reductase NorD protein
VIPTRVVARDEAWARSALARHRRSIEDLERRVAHHRAGLRAIDRQLDGEDVDLAALVDERAARAAGHGGDPRLYVRQEHRRRDFATTVLLDVSLSTDGWVRGHRVLDVARDAVLVLGEVADRLGDRLRVLAFSSETRHRCRVREVRGWNEPWSLGRARIGALRPDGYTRIGAALRHASADLAAVSAERKLLLLVSDGQPTDVDRYEGRYGIADVRQALREAETSGLRAHALAVAAEARDWLPGMFGAGAWHVLPHPERLARVLTEVYGRLTA